MLFWRMGNMDFPSVWPYELAGSFAMVVEKVMMIRGRRAVCHGRRHCQGRQRAKESYILVRSRARR
jgi:hypothetical protein